MKQITIKDKTYGFYEMQDNMLWKKNLPNHITYILNSGEKVTEPFYIPFLDNKDSIRANYKIISTTKDISEEQCKQMLPVYSENYHPNLYANYLNNFYIEIQFKTAKESLQSLIQSLGLDVNKNYLIIEKL